MTTLTIKLSALEARILERRARRAKMTKDNFIRHLIREHSLETAQDVYEDAVSRMGDQRLRVTKHD